MFVDVESAGSCFGIEQSPAATCRKCGGAARGFSVIIFGTSKGVEDSLKTENDFDNEVVFIFIW